MKYVLLIYLDELALSETEREVCYVESTQLAQQIHERGSIWAPTRYTQHQWRPPSACATANGSRPTIRLRRRAKTRQLLPHRRGFARSGRMASIL